MLAHFRIALSALVLGSSAVCAAPTVSFEVLHEFHGPDGNGSIAGPLVKGADGRLYGVLPDGGAYDQGVLFSITRRGRFRLLHNFTGELDGAQPNTLFRDPDGHIYGATAFGGLNPSYGVLFSVSADGTPTVVHNFTGDDGGQINGSLVQFKKGSFYGTTGFGGKGTVYRFTPPATVTTLHTFPLVGPDQVGSYFGLSKADGVFYGTTYPDLQPPGPPAFGTVFRITDSGELTTFYRFTGGADGSFPVGPPVRAVDGNFYGTTSKGGEFGCGTVYRIDATGAFTLVHAFTGDATASDGGACKPFAPLLEGRDGRLYGSALGGIIFRVSLSGELEVLHKSANPNDAVMSQLIEGRAGTFFGTTIGGSFNTGTLFKMVVSD